MANQPHSLDKLNGILASLNPELYSVIPLTRGYKAIVDAIYIEQVLQFSWFAVVGRNEIVYAKTTQVEKGKQITLQKYVWGLSHVGHYVSKVGQLTFKNKVTLDCRSANILDYSGRQNVLRYRTKRPSGSQFKGVREKTSGRFSASIFDGKLVISLGTYDSELKAAKVYDGAARILFDGAAYLNFPDEGIDLSTFDIAATHIQRARNRNKGRIQNCF